MGRKRKFGSKSSKMPSKRKRTQQKSSASQQQQQQQQQASMGMDKKKNSSSISRDNGEEEDRLSCLPDTILLEILSFLDMKHAVQTTILSKQWRNLWTSLCSLTLNIDLWNNEIHLPECLFTRNSLKKLVLSKNGGYNRWPIDVPDSLCLPNLACLHLYSVSFDDEYLTNKFLNCPSLEELIINNVEFLNMNVNIYALKLKELVVKNLDQCNGYGGRPDSKFKLYAPNLTNLTCEDYMSKDYILENLPSLVKADINMKIEAKEEAQNPLLYSNLPVKRKLIYAKEMMQCLEALLCVRSLKLQAPFLEVISGSSGFLESQTTQLCDLTCLRLETWLSWKTIRSITYLFNISPNLRSLFLKISEIKSGSEYIRKYPEIEASLQCLLYRLECVEIRGAVGYVNELKFIEILLKNAKVLKKLVVYTSKVDSPNRQKLLMKFTEKVLKFPSASSDITILVY